MSDLATMTQRIKEELPRNASNDDERIYRAIIDSIRFYRHHRFPWNEESGTFAMVADQQAYGLGSGANNVPADFLWPIALFVEVSNSWRELDQIPFSMLRYLTPTSTQSGYPSKYAWHDNQLWFVAIPFTTDDIRIDYVKDIDTPYATYDGAWEFYEGDGTALAGTYTNAWFTDAEELIRLHAEAQLARVVFKDDELADRLEQRESFILGNLKFNDGLKNNVVRRTSHL